MADNSVALTPVDGNPFVSLTPVAGDPFQQNMALTDYARTLPNVAQPPIGQAGGAPLNDFAPAPVSPTAPQPAIPGLAGVAGDPSRSMAVRIPAAIGSSLADQGMGLAQSAWGAATLPGDVARGMVDPSSPEAIRRSADLAGLLTLPSVGAEANPDVLGAMSGGSKAFEGSKVDGAELHNYEGNGVVYVAPGAHQITPAQPAAGGEASPNIARVGLTPIDHDPFMESVSNLPLDSLTFREAQQNRTNGIVSELGDDVSEWPPIVSIKEPSGGQTILDGHNRAVVAGELGAKTIPSSMISREEYEALKDAGFDDMEISYAAHSRSGADEAASMLGQQFPGAGVAKRGLEAYKRLLDY